MPAILTEKNLLAQAVTPQATASAQQQQPARPRQSGAAPIHVGPTQPPEPIWPTDQPPNPAKVRWDSRGLEIEASNSSLNQILHEVAADTGAKLEGLIQDPLVDQRVFGSYGPGPGCEILSKLLDGSGYNVLMIGSRDGGAPLEIVLSARSSASPPATANNQNRNNSEADEAAKEPEPEPQPAEPPHSQANQNPFTNGGPPPRDPVQFMQEILQRQQVIDQQHNQQNSQME